MRDNVGEGAIDVGAIDDDELFIVVVVVDDDVFNVPDVVTVAVVIDEVKVVLLIVFKDY